MVTHKRKLSNVQDLWVETQETVGGFLGLEVTRVKYTLYLITTRGERQDLGVISKRYLGRGAPTIKSCHFLEWLDVTTPGWEMVRHA